MAKIAYRAEPYDGAAVLFRAELYNWGHPDAHDGWKKLVRGGLEIRDIPVPHHLILLEPQVSVLAKHLSQCLDDAVGDH